MIFCDFGEDFTVYDVDGEQPISNMVAGIDRVNILTIEPRHEKPGLLPMRKQRRRSAVQ